VTGAFGLMDYDEVKKYATVYGHQDLYMRFSSDAMQNLSRTLATVGIFEDAESASAREFVDCKAQIRLALAGLITEEQLGQSLLKEYQSVLQEH